MSNRSLQYTACMIKKYKRFDIKTYLKYLSIIIKILYKILVYYNINSFMIHENLSFYFGACGLLVCLQGA